MKVCVIGGAGYIGSHAVYELIDAGHEVVIIDDFSTGLKEAVHEKAKLYVGDITVFDQIDNIFAEENALKPIDAVMHFAAKIVVPESVEKPSEYYYNNVEGVRIMLDAMVKNNIKNVIFSSTAAVYGEPDNGVCKETDPVSPINPYGETKITSERMIHWFSKAYDLNYCIFRYFNVAGAHKSLVIGLKRDTLTHVIPVTVQTALKIRDKMVVFGNDYDTPDGTCVRDYVHVSDIGAAHVLGMEYIVKNNVSLTINLGSNHGYSVQEVINEVSRYFPVNYEMGPRRAGDPGLLIASNDRAKEILGWSPKYSLEEIIKTDLDFRLKHEK